MKSQKAKNRAVRFFFRKKQLLIIGSLAVLLIGAVGATAAWLMRETDPVVNEFTVAQVTTEVEEEFNGYTKENVTAKNTGDIDAYIRIKLISYRVDENGNRIGGTAEIETFTPGNGWVLHGGYYYYIKTVAPGKTPDVPLLESYELESYDDADGGRQVIEVMAEAIQSEPAEAVGEAWGVTISNGEVTDYEPNSSGQ